MDCHIDWSTSKVEHGKLRVALKPAPDFAFMMKFDGIVDPLEHHRHEGWGAVLLAHGHVVVSDVRVESAPELRAFLDETVRRRIGSPRTLARASNGDHVPTTPVLKRVLAVLDEELLIGIERTVPDEEPESEIAPPPDLITT